MGLVFDQFMEAFSCSKEGVSEGDGGGWGMTTPKPPPSHIGKN